MIEQKWEILLTTEKKQEKNSTLEKLENERLNDRFFKWKYLLQLRNELKGTSRGRAQPNTGRGGAPKFFLNWLTFAL